MIHNVTGWEGGEKDGIPHMPVQRIYRINRAPRKTEPALAYVGEVPRLRPTHRDKDGTATL